MDKDNKGSEEESGGVYDIYENLRKIIERADFSKIVASVDIPLEDSISVLEALDDWIEKSELSENEEFSEEELAIDGMEGDVLAKVLEDIVSSEDFGEFKENNDGRAVDGFVEKYIEGDCPDSVSDKYDSGEYKVSFARKDVVKEVSESEEDIRRGGRSMLEIAGFRDEEAEKRRKKKKGNFI